MIYRIITALFLLTASAYGMDSRLMFLMPVAQKSVTPLDDLNSIQLEETLITVNHLRSTSRAGMPQNADLEESDDIDVEQSEELLASIRLDSMAYMAQKAAREKADEIIKKAKIAQENTAPQKTKNASNQRKSLLKKTLMKNHNNNAMK